MGASEGEGKKKKKSLLAMAITSCVLCVQCFIGPINRGSLESVNYKKLAIYKVSENVPPCMCIVRYFLMCLGSCCHC